MRNPVNLTHNLHLTRPRVIGAAVAGARITMIDSGHLSLITHPDAVTSVLLPAACAVG
jgi:hypothetical protein